uniref:jouberin isoform X4 n=1 Tax=Oncorhynchus gorbuscha TaxID=8017 RepID=UPI001EAEA6D8|nr:jouberin isoform X4 [Oncorhynchus gorbuscha]
MQKIYVQSDGHFEVFTTVFSPQACRARTRYRPREAVKVVAAVNYRPQWPDELQLCQGDIIQVLFRDEPSWWFGRLQNGAEGYFPTACVTRLNQSSSKDAAPDAPCGCTSRGTPKVPRHEKESLFRALGHEASSKSGSAHSSPSLLHRVLSKGHRRKIDAQGLGDVNCSINVAFEPD